MRISDIIALAWKNFISIPRKNVLTIISIMIGVMSVVVISSMGYGSSMLIDSTLINLGVDGLSVYASEGETDPHLADVLSSKLEYVSATTPLTFGYSTYRLRNETNNVIIVGVGENFEDTLNARLLHGRFPSEKDISYAANVAVVSDDFALKYYKRSNIVGKDIFLNIGNGMRQYEIIGVTSSKINFLEAVMSDRLPEMIYVPYTSYNIFSSLEGVDQIAVRCSNDIELAQAGKDIVEFLERNVPGQSLSVENMNFYVEKVKELVHIITFFITGVASISLFVAAIGVINTMISNINGRRHEIGIYMSVGATRKAIWSCFIFESIFLCISGGIAGLILGLIVDIILNMALSVPVSIGLGSMIYSILISIIGGAVLGCVPAVKASLMEPVDVLRE